MSELKLITPRRNFLIRALGFTAAGATLPIGIIEADARAPNTPDPVFAAIDAHKKASKAVGVACAEIDRLFALADETVGPSGIQVLDMREPSSPPGFHPYVRVDIPSEIDHYVPSALHPELHSFYQERLQERNDERADFLASVSPNGDLDSVLGDELPRVKWEAEDALAATVPTTLAGLLAMILHLGEMAKADDCGTFDEAIMPAALPSLVKAAANLHGRYPEAG